MADSEKKTPGPKKRGKLEVGYDSDSEVELSDADSVSSSKSDTAQSEHGDNDDDDMFASDTEKNDKKEKAGFDMAQFEKEQDLQDYKFSELDSGRPSETASNPATEVKLEAFNLREEAESGNFDKDLNYVPVKNSDDENDEDAWMQGLNEQDIQKAKAAQEAQKSKHAGQERRSTEQLLASLVSFLEPAETSMEALSRLRPKKGKRANDDAERQRKSAVFDITECCEQLINSKGVAGAYDMSREEFLRLYKTETGQELHSRGTKRSAEESEAENDYGPAIWEFRWAGDSTVNGPYSAYEMAHWKDTYFENNVEIRLAGTTDFHHVSTVEFEAAEPQ